MHEAGIARQILEVVLREAKAVGATRVLEVRGSVREDESLAASSLLMHFAGYAAGTIAEGARLDFHMTVVAVCCDACGTEYPPQHHLRLCPKCGSREGRLLAPIGIAIDDMDVE